MMLLTIMLGCVLCSLATAYTPPIITAQPEMEVAFIPKKRLKLTCEATGDPEPVYSWKKDGVELDLTSVKKIANGTIELEMLADKDEGSYQCFAKNEYGVAMSTTAVLKQASLESQGTGAVKDYNVKIGQPLILTCNALQSYPASQFSWTVGSASSQSPLTPTKRIQVDLEGNLHFANIEAGEKSDTNIYKCSQNNVVLGFVSSGSESKIIVEDAVAGATLPTKAYASGDTVAVIGKNMTLQCLFNAYPTPSIIWSRDGKDLPKDRHTISQFGTLLTVTKVQEEDGGKYVCTASNNKGNVKHELEVNVESAPMLKSKSKPLQTFDSVEDDEAEFYCKVEGEPEPKVQWFINGKPVNEESGEDTSGASIDLDDDDTKLEIKHLCNDCSNKTAALSVQCIATNAHGSVYAQGYVNVFYGEKETSYLYIVIGVLVAAALFIIVIIIVVVIIIMVRKKKKSSKGEYQVPTTQNKDDEL